MANHEWARPPWQNFPQSQYHPLNTTFTTLIICNFPPQPKPHHARTLAFIIPILLAFLQVQSMGKDALSPFQVNPVTTMASLISILAYYLAFEASLRFPTYASQLGMAMAASGSLSVASLVSLLLPHSWWFIRYIFYDVLFFGELHQMVRSLYYYSYVHRFRLSQRAPAPHIRRVPPLLPQTFMDLAIHRD